MNTSLVSSIEGVARSRLVTVGADALLLDVAKLLANTQVSLVVVCGVNGAMVGVVTKTNLVQQIGHCQGGACRTAAADLMTSDVTYCRPTDMLAEVLSRMEERGFVHVPIVDQRARPLGVVNARDALRALVAAGEYEEALLRDYVMGIGYR